MYTQNRLIRVTNVPIKRRNTEGTEALKEDEFPQNGSPKFRITDNIYFLIN